MNCDVAIIGGGPAGYVCAIRAAQLGKTVVLIDERKSLGGTCLNVGCIPSKALLDSSELYARVRDEGKAHGLRVSDLSVDVPAMQQRKTQVVSKLTAGVAGLMKKNSVTVVYGTARVVSPTIVHVHAEAGEQRITTSAVVIATGSVPVEIPACPFDGKTVISSTEALTLTEVPQRMLVVGAGAIGLELGSVWMRLGAQVTVCELLPEILPRTDARVAAALRRSLKQQGMQFMLKHSVEGVQKNETGGVSVTITGEESGKTVVETDVVLVAVGRKPYTEGVGLDALDIQVDRAGRIIVDDTYASSVPGIYAIGDVIVGPGTGADGNPRVTPMLAHKAEEEGVAVAEILAGKYGHVNYDIIPNVVYTWPEVAVVGKSEEELQAGGVAYSVGRFPFAANGRALAMDASDGFVKLLAAEEDGKVLGAHIIGPWASDLIGEIVAVMEFGGAAEDIARSVHAHPTLSEAIKESAWAIAGGNALHS